MQTKVARAVWVRVLFGAAFVVPLPALGAAADDASSSSREAALEITLKRTESRDALLTLKAEDHEFLAIGIATAGGVEPRGGVIVLADDGMTLSDPLPTAIRHVLSPSGWQSLSLQMPLKAPISGTEGKHKDPVFCARLAAGFTYLSSKQVARIVLVGLGPALDRAFAYSKEGFPPSVVGLAGIGRWRTRPKENEFPTLDLVPSGDEVAVSAAARRQTAATLVAASAYRQVVIEVPDGVFQGGEAEAAKRLRGWVNQLSTTKS
ncbi:MAG: DUF3530 family protein [Gammaproteobacteria bacterium]|nr:DUF3530 family protein [Gammaproteobacteria bacterium]